MSADQAEKYRAAMAEKAGPVAQTGGAEHLREVLWQAPSIERLGEDCFLVEFNAASGALALYEGQPGNLAKVSVECPRAKALEKAELVLRGDAGALADKRVTVALAMALVEAFARSASRRQISIAPRLKDGDL